uniref:Sodium channel protein Nach n=1 Tax=Anopheles coluzzii TaxID=1518534 RepID=A0A6E8VR77_ANOCL
MAAIRGMLFLGQYQYDRYRANPTAIQMDKNYRDWIGIMPGLTFCFHDRIDWNRAWEYLERIQLTGHEATREGLAANETTGTYRRYLADFVQTLVGVTATELGNLSHFLTDRRLATGVNILELISTVHPNHDIAINSFQPEHGARLQVHQIVTERGICYALNAPLALLQGVNGTSGQVASGKGFPGWSPIECEFSQHECYMKLDMFRSIVSYTIHSPYEVSTSDQLFTHVEESDELVAVYSVLETVANERLKDLTVRQRKCYFYDEAYENLQFYSYNLCIMNCRAKRALAVCQCRPHFYPFAEGPPCTVAGLHCLQQHPGWSSDADCKCLKSCTDVGYYVASLSKTQWYVVRTAEGGIPFTHKASLRWEILQPKTRLRRVLIFSYEDLLVSVGGAIALFFGKNGFYLSKIIEFLSIELGGWVRKKYIKRKERKRKRKHAIQLVAPK